MPTSGNAQAPWTSRLRRPTPVYDWFLEREFESDDERCARTKQALMRLLRFCGTNVSHYSRLFRGMTNFAPSADQT